MEPTKQDIVALLLEVIEEYNSYNSPKVDTTNGEHAAFFSPSSPLDSMGLVTIIVDTEAIMEDRFGKQLLLADEKAMSKKVSPFLTIGRFADFILECYHAA
jgi:hypothetical protein